MVFPRAEHWVLQKADWMETQKAGRLAWSMVEWSDVPRAASRAERTAGSTVSRLAVSTGSRSVEMSDLHLAVLWEPLWAERKVFQKAGLTAQQTAAQRDSWTVHCLAGSKAECWAVRWENLTAGCWAFRSADKMGARRAVNSAPDSVEQMGWRWAEHLASWRAEQRGDQKAESTAQHLVASLAQQMAVHWDEHSVESLVLRLAG